MIRTCTNVTGDMMTAVVVGNSEGELDRERFYKAEEDKIVADNA